MYNDYRTPARLRLSLRRGRIYFRQRRQKTPKNPRKHAVLADLVEPKRQEFEPDRGGRTYFSLTGRLTVWEACCPEEREDRPLSLFDTHLHVPSHGDTCGPSCRFRKACLADFLRPLNRNLTITF